MRIYPFESLSSLKEANPVLGDLLRSSVSNSEQIVLGYYFLRGGYTCLAALTTQRVVAGYVMDPVTRLTMRVFGEQKADEYVGTLPLQDISSVNQMRKRLYPATPEWIQMTGYDESRPFTFYFPSRDEFYHRMLTLLRDSVDRARSRQQAPSAADRLRELTALRDDGLITEDELQTKRQQLIANL